MSGACHNVHAPHDEPQQGDYDVYPVGDRHVAIRPRHRRHRSACGTFPVRSFSDSQILGQGGVELSCSAFSIVRLPVSKRPKTFWPEADARAVLRAPAWLVGDSRTLDPSGSCRTRHRSRPDPARKRHVITAVNGGSIPSPCLHGRSPSCVVRALLWCLASHPRSPPVQSRARRGD